MLIFFLTLYIDCVQTKCNDNPSMPQYYTTYLFIGDNGAWFNQYLNPCSLFSALLLLWLSISSLLQSTSQIYKNSFSFVSFASDLLVSLQDIFVKKTIIALIKHIKDLT